MKPIKSERLRKLETELHDLQEWLRLGLVPKKDLEKHKDEIRVLQGKIEEEKERLQFLKEGGEGEEFIVPKRSPAKGAYNEMPTIPDVDAHETGAGLTEGGFEMHTYVSEETTLEEDTEEEYYTTAEFDEGDAGEEGDAHEDADEEEEDESYFSDRNRWRRGGIVDPDADEW
jgi:hypothetical protein